MEEEHNDDVWHRTDRDTANNFRERVDSCCCCRPAKKQTMPPHNTPPPKAVVPVATRLPPRTPLRVAAPWAVVHSRRVGVVRTPVDRTSAGTARAAADVTSVRVVAHCNRTVLRRRFEGHCLDTPRHRSNHSKHPPHPQPSCGGCCCCLLQKS